MLLKFGRKKLDHKNQTVSKTDQHDLIAGVFDGVVDEFECADFVVFFEEGIAEFHLVFEGYDFVYGQEGYGSFGS